MLASKKKSSSASLREMSAEEFMAMVSGSEEDEPIRNGGDNTATIKTKGKKRRRKLPREATPTTDNGFFQLLEDNDVNFSNSELSEEEDDDDVGVTEARPCGVTSWKEKEEFQSSEDEEDDDEEGKSPVRVGKEAQRKMVTLTMVKKWVRLINKTQSLHALHHLCGSLHTTAALHTPGGEEEEETKKPVISDSAVFDSLVASCFKCVSPCLYHHLPLTTTSTTSLTKKPCLPSSQEAWYKVKRTVKQYLSDLLRLLQVLQESSMQCLVLKQVQTMLIYYLCFPKILKRLNKCLVEKWSAGENHVQVLAFLALRKLVLFQPHPSLHTLLKKLYWSYVRNCKFSGASSLPTIRFMTNSLVEMMAIDPPTTYQHGFVYIRQLALHLRAALTSGKKDAQKAVYNWQYIHCLNLWGHVLSHVTHPSLRPLVYPLVQTALGTLGLQPAAKYHPLRLHLLGLLLQLSTSTNTFIPIAPYMVEMLEVHGNGGSNTLETGKAPDLSVLLRASKQQLNTRAFHSALLNKVFELLLQYFADHAHYIGFPELVYPVLVRLRKVVKETPYSWLRAHLKQLIEKVTQVSEDIAKERAVVSFSPKDSDLVLSWESKRRVKETALSRFLTTWNKVNKASEEVEAKTKLEQESFHLSSDDDEDEDGRSSGDSGSDEGMDMVEDLQLSSESD